MSKFPSKSLFLIPIANNLLENYINTRQLTKLSQEVPEITKKLVGETKFEKAIAYNKEKLIFNIFTSLFTSAEEVLILFFMASLYHSKFAGIVFSDAIFSTFLSLLSLIANVPFGLFYDFWIEKKYGFNKKTLGIFFYDLFISVVLIILIQLPVLIAIFYIIKRFSRFYFYVWLLIATVQIVLVLIYPSVIAPLFNKFTPLEEGPLKTKIEELATKVGFSVQKISVMDGSKRSGHSNAYFIGFGKVKSIVLYDTLLEHLNEEEILAVLGHELGHCFYHHVYLGVALMLSNLLAFLYLFNVFFSSSDTEPICIKFYKFNTSVSLVNTPLKMGINLIKRIWERQADRFAVDLGFGDQLKSALVKLHLKNECVPVIDWLYSAIHFDHPHTTERIETIEAEMKKKE